ncbi:hypothetical protein ACFLT7_02420 [candidate division KSB1 bacterium]
MRVLRIVLPIMLISTVLTAFGGGCAKQKPFTGGNLSREKLAEAVAAAGFNVRRMEADIPKSIRPNYPWRTFAYDDSLLTELRRTYNLEGITTEADTEWQAQLLLKGWVHSKITNGTPTVSADHALDILRHSAEGKKFWCTYFAITYVEAALASGWQARKVILDHYHGPEGMTSQHHGAAEVWSNQFRKWIFIDPQSNLHFEKEGTPLSAWEIRGEWLRNGGVDVDHVVGVPPNTKRQNPAIVWWKLPEEDETALFFWLGFYDNYATWEEDSPSKWLFPQDSAHVGKVWYQNNSQTKQGRPHAGYRNKLFLPTGKIDDVYWTVGIVEGTITEAKAGRVVLSLDSYCPDLEAYEASFDDGERWRRVSNSQRVTWQLDKGKNSLALRTRNRAGVTGPETSVRLYLN